MWTGSGRALTALLLLAVSAVNVSLTWVGLLLQAAALGTAWWLAQRRSFIAAATGALLASLAPQLAVTVFRYLVWDPGLVLRSVLILLFTLPLAWLLIPGHAETTAPAE